MSVNFNGKSLHMKALGQGLVELCFDRQGESVNKFDRQTVDEWQQAINQLKAADGVRGVLVTSGKASFIVGADIFEFTPLFEVPESEISAFNAGQAAVFTAFSELPVPLVVAINGMAFGGGFEMALSADHRVMADAAVVGLPEVSLGIMPGYGGTVRLPRIAGSATALAWTTSGAPQKAAAALAAGAVDAVVPLAELRTQALAWLADAAAGRVDWRARRQQTRGPVALDADALAQAEAATAKTARHYPAAAAFIAHLKRSAGLNADAALAQEALAFAQIAKTPTAAALVRLFLNDQFIKKKGKAYAKAARPLKQAAVLGAGIMGGGIAYTSAVRGTPVLMKDLNQAALDLGMNEADKLLARQVDSGRMSADKAAGVRAAIQPTLSYEAFDQVDIVVEAIVENIRIKKAVLGELEGLVRDDAILASNTSSLSITEMAGALKRPQNFVGMHFFNPVPLMPLVEVISHPGTDPVAAATTAGYAMAMGKTPIVVQDCPGFLVNRILNAYTLGFLQLLHDGADFREVDRVMEAFGWPMGPAYLQDVIGMDTLAHVVDVISAGYPDRMTLGFQTAPQLLVEHKRLGQKSGAGYYRYEADAKGKPKKMADPDAVALLATIQPGGPEAFSDEETVDRLMLAMALEAGRCLDDGVAESAIEVDMGLILGLGFPRHIGGILHWADRQGLAGLVEKADRYAAISTLYQASDKLRARAAEGRRFHEN